ncbi:hypothetical protein BLNAU_18720 [Blattamonas nauphoetae]|uniref:Uncharacterized protein n=1 Tax=Blattamonas nauphoetae TaxID=2049346 RepID=A0ABQ9X4W5_9EUKA|nr:hypothetical protein BLNAU_18720 [Blattamonas nauphoetae]
MIQTQADLKAAFIPSKNLLLECVGNQVFVESYQDNSTPRKLLLESPHPARIASASHDLRSVWLVEERTEEKVQTQWLVVRTADDGKAVLEIKIVPTIVAISCSPDIVVIFCDHIVILVNPTDFTILGTISISSPTPLEPINKDATALSHPSFFTSDSPSNEHAKILIPLNGRDGYLLAVVDVSDNSYFVCRKNEFSLKNLSQYPPTEDELEENQPIFQVDHIIPCAETAQDNPTYWIFKAANHKLSRASFSPDGQYVLTCSQNGTRVVMWDTLNNTMYREFYCSSRGNTRTIQSMVLTHDNHVLASVSEHDTIHLWKTDIDGQTLEESATPDEPQLQKTQTILEWVTGKQNSDFKIRLKETLIKGIKVQSSVSKLVFGEKRIVTTDDKMETYYDLYCLHSAGLVGSFGVPASLSIKSNLVVNEALNLKNDSATK